MNLEEKRVQEGLAQLDPLLFLDKVWSRLGYVYWTVKRQMPDGVEPLTVVEWCGEDGWPLPLSLSLVDQVRSQEGDIRDAISQATANNAARKELARQEKERMRNEAIDEYQKSRPAQLTSINLGTRTPGY